MTQTALRLIGLKIPPPSQFLISLSRDILQRLFVVIGQGFAWWRVEVRRNKTVQYGTIITLVAIVALSIWLYHRKPSTPWQRLQRNLGLLILPARKGLKLLQIVCKSFSSSL